MQKPAVESGLHHCFARQRNCNYENRNLNRETDKNKNRQKSLWVFERILSGEKQYDWQQKRQKQPIRLTAQLEPYGLQGRKRKAHSHVRYGLRISESQAVEPFERQPRQADRRKDRDRDGDESFQGITVYLSRFQFLSRDPGGQQKNDRRINDGRLVFRKEQQSE